MLRIEIRRFPDKKKYNIKLFQKQLWDLKPEFLWKILNIFSKWMKTYENVNNHEINKFVKKE